MLAFDGYQVSVFPAAVTADVVGRVTAEQALDALAEVVRHSPGSVLIRAERPMARHVIVTIQPRRNHDGATGPPHWLALTCRRQLDVLWDWMTLGGPLLDDELPAASPGAISAGSGLIPDQGGHGLGVGGVDATQARNPVEAAVGGQHSC